MLPVRSTESPPPPAAPSTEGPPPLPAATPELDMAASDFDAVTASAFRVTKWVSENMGDCLFVRAPGCHFLRDGSESKEDFNSRVSIEIGSLDLVYSQMIVSFLHPPEGENFLCSTYSIQNDPTEGVKRLFYIGQSMRKWQIKEDQFPGLPAFLNR